MIFPSIPPSFPMLSSKGVSAGCPWIIQQVQSCRKDSCQRVIANGHHQKLHLRDQGLIQYKDAILPV